MAGLDAGPTAVLARDGGPTTLLPEAGTTVTVRPPRGLPRWVVAVTAFLLFAIAAVAGFTWQRGLWAGDRVQGGPTASPSGAGPVAAGLIAGFAACGPAYCPIQPMCWAGLTLTGGVAQLVGAMEECNAVFLNALLAKHGSLQMPRDHFWELSLYIDNGMIPIVISIPPDRR